MPITRTLLPRSSERRDSRDAREIFGEDEDLAAVAAVVEDWGPGVEGGGRAGLVLAEGDVGCGEGRGVEEFHCGEGEGRDVRRSGL